MKNPISKSITDAQILDTVIHELITAKKVRSLNDFSKQLRYGSSMSIYNVLKSVNGISEDMIARIRVNFPEVNLDYLITGEGPITNEQIRKDLFPLGSEIEKRFSFRDLEHVPAQLNRLEAQLSRIEQMMLSSKQYA